MAANVSIWIRAFRLPLQRNFPRLEETEDADDIDFDELLRAADERQSERKPRDDEEQPRRKH
jgi:hypothetical protein